MGDLCFGRGIIFNIKDLLLGNAFAGCVWDRSGLKAGLVLQVWGRVVIFKYITDSREDQTFCEPQEGVRQLELRRGSAYGPMSPASLIIRYPELALAAIK